MRHCKFYAVAVAVLCFHGLLSPVPVESGEEPKSESTLPLPANLIRVPLVRQSTSYTCGVAALQSVFGYYGEEHREDELSRALKSNSRIGTAYRRIERYARQSGFTVDIQKEMKIEKLKEVLASGQPVICLLQAWPDKPVDFATDWNDGHYVVACGFDRANIFFMDPSTLGSYTFIPSDEFLNRWHDTDGKEKLVHFGMIVSKPKRPSVQDFEKARKMN